MWSLTWYPKVMSLSHIPTLPTCWYAWSFSLRQVLVELLVSASEIWGFDPVFGVKCMLWVGDVNAIVMAAKGR